MGAREVISALRPACRAPHLLLLLATLAGCASAARPAQPPPAPVVRPPTAFNTPAATDVGGLHVETTGFSCGGGHIVLSDVRTSYDAATLTAIGVYVAAFAAATGADAGAYDAATAARLPRVPDGIAVVPGAPTCSATLTVVDTGTSPVELDGAGLAARADPVRNVFSYRLVDCATLADAAACHGHTPGQGPCAYAVALQLGGDASSQLTGRVAGDATSGCPLPLAIQPGATARLRIDVGSVPSNLVYTASLTLLLSAGGAAQTLALPAALGGTLAFADATRFSCYGLQGDHFVLEAPPPFDPQDPAHAHCL
jgi:hypothetical protein